MNIFFYLLWLLRKIVSVLKTYAFRKSVVSSASVKFGRYSDIVNIHGGRNRIVIGVNSFIDGQLLLLQHDAKLEIGNNCYIGQNSRIWAASKISIGNRVLISHNVNIHDSDAHSKDLHLRALHFHEIFHHGHPKKIDKLITNEIVIKDDAWIGFGATIMKGVSIGKGAIVGACSVVLHDVPDNAIVTGNPARILNKK